MASARRNRPKFRCRDDMVRCTVLRQVLYRPPAKCTLINIVNETGVFRSVREAYDWLLIDDQRRIFLLTSGSTLEATKIGIEVDGLEVCTFYNQKGPKDGCRKGKVCWRLHVCIHYVSGCCNFQDLCSRSHNLKDFHNAMIMKRLNLVDLTHQELQRIVCLKLKSGQTNNQPESRKREKETPDSSSTMLIDEKKIFYFLLNSYTNETICYLSDFLKEFSEFATTKEIVQWAKSKTGRSILTLIPNTTVQESMVLPHLDIITLCFRYSSGSACAEDECNYLHICTQHVAGHCAKLACELSHSLLSKHNQKILKNIGMIESAEDQILLALRCSLPILCDGHSIKGDCYKETTCFRYHLCKDFVKTKRCRNLRCQLGHDFTSQHNKKLLSAFQVKNEKHLLNCIIYSDWESETFPLNVYFGEFLWSIAPEGDVANGFNELSITGSNSPSLFAGYHTPTVVRGAAGSTHPKYVVPARTANKLWLMNESPTAVPICHKNLTGQCPDGRGCRLHHYDVPYLWCVKLFDIWHPLEQDNASVEQKFCDPSAGSVKISLILPTTGTSMNWQIEIKLEEMDSEMVCPAITRNGLNEEMVSLSACRLSTPSYVMLEDVDVFSTVWTWYWESEHGWIAYGHGDAVPKQDVIEARYLHNDPREMLFEYGNFIYAFNFQEFFQQNQKTETKRSTRRRPLYVKEDDVQSKVFPNKPQRFYNKDHLPQSWFPMDSKSPGYDLVPMDTANSEYQNIEQNFNKTVTTSEYTIRNIFKVQNIMQWKCFQSKIDDMTRKSGVAPTEQMLFHGTDTEDVVRGICYQNFDPRMHGKNATMYGRGVYFARDASYSDRYTSRSDTVRYMFYAKVLTGSYVTGDQSMMRPPNLPGSKFDLYDSTVDNVSKPSIYVVYDSSQCYPAYLIKYGRSRFSSTNSGYSIGSQTSIRPDKGAV